MKDFCYYRDCFSNLHTAKSKGVFAPHKPLLLLSVIDLVEQGLIRSNRVELSDALISAFKINTAKYIGHSTLFSPNIGQPFYHMQHEPFWRLIPAAEELGLAAEQQPTYGKKSVSYSIATLRAKYSYTLLDPELFHLLQTEDARAQLRVVLISTYFTRQPSTIATLAILPACLSLISLIA